MLKSSLTGSLTRRSTTRGRSPRLYPVACRPTHQVRPVEIALSQHARRLPLAPTNQADLARTARPDPNALRTSGAWAAYPQTGLLNRLVTLLATEPEPDKILAYLMQDLAEQIGADAMYLLRSDAATQTLALAPWVIVDGAIQHRDTIRTLMPLTHASAIEPPAAPQVERYALHHRRHSYLRPTNIVRFRHQGYRVGLTLPLLAGGQTLGFLECMARDDVAFLPTEIDHARLLAEQVSLAVQLSRLMEHAARAAALQERQRLAREIHDTIGQTFTAILVQLRSAEETLGNAPDQACITIGYVREIARDGLAATRRAVDVLRPQSLDRIDLPTALRRAVVQATLGLPLDVECNVHGDVYTLSFDTATHLLRIVQEALSNTLKYAEARRLTIELVFEPEQAQLRVQDDGRGFDPTLAAAAGGFGLLSMRARAATIGAELTMCSAPGQGTTLVVALPRNAGESYDN